MDRMQSQARMEDAAVVAQVLAGDREAYRALVDRHSRNIFRVAFRVVHNDEDSEEIVQETFLRAYRNLAGFEQRANFSTWLYRIALNCALDMKKKRRHETGFVPIAEDPDPETNEVQVAATGASPERLAYSQRLRATVQSAMLELSDMERVAFTMRHIDGCSIDEIAEVLGVNGNAAKNRVYHAVKKIRTALGPVVVSLR